MSLQSEAQLEAELVKRLNGKGWDSVQLPDETALWLNVRRQLEKQNNTTFSNEEFARVRNELEKGNVFEKAEILRGRFALKRDDGSLDYIHFFNSEHWCRNQYQVATQIGIEGRRKNRYDVTLLVNGIPLCQIELKRRGVELKAAFDQINRYQKDSFQAAGGLFQYVQIFVISNGVNTRYYANNRHQSFKQTFHWADKENKPINRLEAFADFFLEKCHLSKMIAKYVVMHQSDKILMVLRSYQYFAAEAIAERVQLGRQNGYIWHTTGSGKTLTSFKAAQNLIAIPKVDKVVFVVDRADLDYQTTKEFNHFKEGSVDGTNNTKALVEQLSDINTKLIVTTIQKLNTAISREKFSPALEDIKQGRVVFIFDECHRSQFGDAHRRIKDAFPRAQMFGFTGTPIFADNAIGMRTTRDLFDECLHRYVITDAIRDDNVLRFSVEYLGQESDGTGGQTVPETDQNSDKKAGQKVVKKREKFFASKDFLEHPDRIDSVVNWIIDNHDRKTRTRQFGSILAVGSVDGLIQYYETFRRKRLEGLHHLNIATIFTYAANEDDPDADGLIPDTEFPADTIPPTALPKRDKLASFVDDYNTLYGVKESVLDGKGFYNYYRSLAKRVKLRDYKPFNPDEGIDILLVVNMFLTGFDAKTVNTLYVDKNLKYHGLIQAFSRTNRILNTEKSQGNIICFRDLKDRTDEAIALFADKNAREVILVGNYEEHLARMEEAIRTLKDITPDPDSVDDLPDENAEAEFVTAFREVLRIKNVLSTFSEFDESDIFLEPQVYEEFKSKYLDIAEKRKKKEKDEEEETLLDNIDFELELIRHDEINVAYIIALLTSMRRMDDGDVKETKKAKEYRKRIFDLLHTDISLRAKRPFIEKFMDQKMQMLGPEDDLREAFAAFWNEERNKAFGELVLKEKLHPEGFQKLMSKMHFTGKRPLGGEVAEIMLEKPGIIARRVATERIISSVEDLIETFDEGLGDFE